jgi:hypothetical protein
VHIPFCVVVWGGCLCAYGSWSFLPVQNHQWISTKWIVSLINLDSLLTLTSHLSRVVQAEIKKPDANGRKSVAANAPEINGLATAMQRLPMPAAAMPPPPAPPVPEAPPSAAKQRKGDERSSRNTGAAASKASASAAAANGRDQHPTSAAELAHSNGSQEPRGSPSMQQQRNRDLARRRAKAAAAAAAAAAPPPKPREALTHAVSGSRGSEASDTSGSAAISLASRAPFSEPSVPDPGEDPALDALLAAEEDLLAAHRAHIEDTMTGVREEMSLLAALDAGEADGGGGVEVYVEELGAMLVQKVGGWGCSCFEGAVTGIFWQ